MNLFEYSQRVKKLMLIEQSKQQKIWNSMTFLRYFLRILSQVFKKVILFQYHLILVIPYPFLM